MEYAHKRNHRRGFTLIEMLVAAAILGVFVAVVIFSINSVRTSTNDKKRIADMNYVRAALDMYYDANNAYPSTSGAWVGECYSFGNKSDPNTVIPGLAPTYISRVPSDPNMVKSTDTCCYLYRSNGTDYKFLAAYNNCSSTKLCSNVQTSSPYYDPYPRTNACMITSSSAVTATW